jgi:hypothetical protein
MSNCKSVAKIWLKHYTVNCVERGKVHAKYLHFRVSLEIVQEFKILGK